MSNSNHKKQKRNILKLIIQILMVITFIFAIINLFTHNMIRDKWIKGEQYHDYESR